MLILTTGNIPFAMHPYVPNVVRHGDYLFVIYLSADWHHRVVRLDAATLTSHGDIDLGATEIEDTHVYPSLTIDPTDDCLVVTSGARALNDSTDVQAKLWKSAHAYGGTNEQWAAGDFGSHVTLPYPATGLCSYNIPVMLPDGTLLILGSERPANGVGRTGVFVSFALWLYRYSGDTTSKTASQLASGSWTKLVLPPSGTGVLTNPYAYPGGGMVYDDGVLHVPLSCYLGADGDGTWRRWGKGYICTANPTDATPTWKKADGTTLSMPLALDAAARADDVLFPGKEYGDYSGVLSIVDGNPRIAAEARTVADGVITGSGASVYTWTGEAWDEHVLCAKDEGIVAGPIISGVTTQVLPLFFSHVEDDTYWLASGRNVTDPDQAMSERLVIDTETGGQWSTRQFSGSGEITLHGEYLGDGLLAYMTFDEDDSSASIIIEALDPAQYDFDVLLRYIEPSISDYDFDVLLAYVALYRHRRRFALIDPLAPTRL